MDPAVLQYSKLSDFDVYQFGIGRHYHIQELLGSHLMTFNDLEGCYFAVWAPNAIQVAVIGTFNAWQQNQLLLYRRKDKSGIWEGFIPGVKQGDIYKYAISGADGFLYEKADPYAVHSETPPATGSKVWDLSGYIWKDSGWFDVQDPEKKFAKPLSIYELHLGSWNKHEEKEDSFLSYRDLADQIVSYVSELGFTHIELMPVMEYPFYQSWGYQITGYFAASSRFGTPQDLMYLIDQCHQSNIGVILDWVPSHFPADAHGLANFDGSRLYEHPDPQLGYHPDWQSMIFNYGRHEVRSFLVSNALFWMKEFHADGLRVDAVASILHHNYSRKEGEWKPNIYGGVENLEAIEVLREVNNSVHAAFPAALMIAEESTTFPLVTTPSNQNGLGFDYKWMMGWMNDTLKYFSMDPYFRNGAHHTITFSIHYAYSERFILPFSHDEVVHGKASMIYKMFGDESMKFASLRLLYTYMYTHPGAKLLFMGDEFAQTSEWNHNRKLSWDLLQYPLHKGVQNLIKQLNNLYRNSPALHELDFSTDGFLWVIANDQTNSVLSYCRRSHNPQDDLLVILNCSPLYLKGYHIELSRQIKWKVIFQSNQIEWGGSSKKFPSLKALMIKNIEGATNEYLRLDLLPYDALILKRLN